MKIPEGYLPRDGDVILIRATVRFDVEAGEDSVHIKVGYTSASVDLDKIEGLVGRLWKPEERVIWRGDAGKIVAICDEFAWVKFDHSGLSAVLALELIPEPRGADQFHQIVPEPTPIPPPPAADDDEIKF